MQHASATEREIPAETKRIAPQTGRSLRICHLSFSNLSPVATLSARSIRGPLAVVMANADVFKVWFQGRLQPNMIKPV